MLEKFVAEAYVKLVDVEVQRLNIPERDFTGREVYRFSTVSTVSLIIRL